MRLTQPRFIVLLATLLTLVFATAASAAPTPSNLVASNVGQTTATLGWSVPSGTYGTFGLYRNGRFVAITKASTYTFTGLTCGTSYALGVRTFLGGGNASPRADLMVSTAACGGAGSPPPTTPGQTAPANTALPTIAGTTTTGSTLSASSGSWSGSAPMSHSYTWSRCDASGGACVVITNATGQTYVLTASDVGKRLRAVVRASNSAGSSTASSLPSSAVATTGSTPAPTPTPTPTPTPGGGNSVVRVDQPWVCNGAVNLDLVKVTMRTADRDAISLSTGCTGRIGRIEVETWTQDGVKIQNASSNAARDLVIGGGFVKCYGMTPGAHQDAVQAMGGARITFTGVTFDCLGNSNFFVNRGGSGATTPTDVVCDGCWFGASSSTTVRVNVSVRSGVRNSTGCPGRNVQEPFYFTSSASSPVNLGNVRLGSSDPAC